MCAEGWVCTRVYKREGSFSHLLHTVNFGRLTVLNYIEHQRLLNWASQLSAFYFLLSFFFTSFLPFCLSYFVLHLTFKCLYTCVPWLIQHLFIEHRLFQIFLGNCERCWMYLLAVDLYCVFLVWSLCSISVFYGRLRMHCLY